MQDEPTCGSASVGVCRAEAVVMLMLLGGVHGWPWSMGEIERELGDQDLATMAVAGLHASGLVHRFGELVTPTRPATRMRQLEDLLLTREAIMGFGPAPDLTA